MTRELPCQQFDINKEEMEFQAPVRDMTRAVSMLISGRGRGCSS